MQYTVPLAAPFRRQSIVDVVEPAHHHVNPSARTNAFGQEPTPQRRTRINRKIDRVLRTERQENHGQRNNKLDETVDELPTEAQPVEKQAEANSDEKTDYGHSARISPMRPLLEQQDNSAAE
jgi:hypothetical protein